MNSQVPWIMKLLVYFSISTLLIPDYIGDLGNFHGDFSIHPLCISLISSISITYPYLQWWFRWLFCPTHLYISEFGDFHTQTLCTSVISTISIPYLYLQWWFRWLPYSTNLYGDFHILSLSILVISVIFTMISQCNLSVRQWFQQFLYPTHIYNSDFWWLLYHTNLYIADFGDFHTLSILVISVISQCNLTVCQRFQQFLYPIPIQWFIYNFIPMRPRTRLGYIKWVLLENWCAVKMPEVKMPYAKMP